MSTQLFGLGALPVEQFRVAFFIEMKKAVDDLELVTVGQRVQDAAQHIYTLHSFLRVCMEWNTVFRLRFGVLVSLRISCSKRLDRF